ncbi:MAG: pirin family protein [Bacteroidales bacterium]
MSNKNVERILVPGTPHFVGDGFRVHNYIPGELGLGMERMDPFLLLDYNPVWEVTPREHPRGVGVHPHRGFETVTIAYKGSVAHHDSSGGGGVIHPGDVQWMTAGSGILHKEYHEEGFSRSGGTFHMVQLWVNLPARVKRTPPRYQALKNASLGNVILPGEGGRVEIIAGSFEGVSGPAKTFSPVHLSNVRLNAGGRVHFSFPESHHTALLVVEGEATIQEDTDVPADRFVLFGSKGTDVSIHTVSGCVVLVLSGEPLGEPIAAQGPFVMNTREELKEAYHDFLTGKFGELAD